MKSTLTRSPPASKALIDTGERLSIDWLHMLVSLIVFRADMFRSRVCRLRSRTLLLVLLHLESDNFDWLKAKVEWPRNVSPITEMDFDMRMGLSRKLRSPSCMMPTDSREDALCLATSRSLLLLLLDDPPRPWPTGKVSVERITTIVSATHTIYILWILQVTRAENQPNGICLGLKQIISITHNWQANIWYHCIDDRLC